MKSFFLILLFPVVLWVAVSLILTVNLYWTKEAVLSFPDARDQVYPVVMNLFGLIGPVILIRGIVSFFFYRQIIFKFSGARPLTRTENPEIYNIVENLCISQGLPVPHIGILDDDSCNAFATGWDVSKSWIVFSRGLLAKLNKAEIESVAAHELSHIINKDSLLMVVIVVFVGIIGTLGQILIRVRSKDDSGKGNPLILVGIVFLIVGYLLYPFIQFAISRKREFLADAGSVMMTKDKYAMISALQKISQDPIIESIEKDTVAAMCIQTPFGTAKSKFKSLLSTHPSIEDRIKALESY